jgi:FAD/FMN-containing dehydrogenase
MSASPRCGLPAHIDPERRGAVAYGHLGDGNLHFNVSAAAGVDPGRLPARVPAVSRAIHDLVREFGGSFSAEHGIGRLKVGDLERYPDAVELQLMNPGKVLRA